MSELPLKALISQALWVSMKFLIVGVFIGLFYFICLILIGKFIDGDIKQSDFIDSLISLVELYPFGLIAGGVPALIVGFFLKVYLNLDYTITPLLHSIWFGGLVGSFWMSMFIGFKLYPVLIFATVPSILASVCCTYWFIIPKSLKV